MSMVQYSSVFCRCRPSPSKPNSPSRPAQVQATPDWALHSMRGWVRSGSSPGQPPSRNAATTSGLRVIDHLRGDLVPLVQHDTPRERGGQHLPADRPDPALGIDPDRVEGLVGEDLGLFLDPALVLAAV